MFVLPHGGCLKISEDVLKRTQSYQQLRESDLEAGGMLIGHHPIGTTDIILDRITEPQPGDRRTRNRFYRSQDAHQRLLDEEWERSNYTRNYVGEWHTHPQKSPQPSWLDRMSWLRAMRGTDFCGSGLVFIIVGTSVSKIWFCSKSRRVPKLIQTLRIEERRFK